MRRIMIWLRGSYAKNSNPIDKMRRINEVGAMLNLAFLRYFCAIVEEGSISAAAKSLFVSQQAVSSALMKLEKELGVRLFDRTPSLVLTTIGEKIYDHALEMLRKQELLLGEILLYKQGKNAIITIGAAPCRAQYLYPKIFEAIKEQFPHLEIRLVERFNSEALERSVVNGEIDFSLGQSAPNSNEVQCITLFRERLCLVVPDHMMKRSFDEQSSLFVEDFERNGVRVETLLGNPFFLPKRDNRNRQVFDRYLEKRGIYIPVVLESDTIETLLSFAIRGQCVTIYPELLLRRQLAEMSAEQREKVHFFHINDDMAVTTQVLASKKGRKLGKDERRMLAVFRDICRNTFLEHGVS